MTRSLFFLAGAAGALTVSLLACSGVNSGGGADFGGNGTTANGSTGTSQSGTPGSTSSGDTGTFVSTGAGTSGTSSATGGVVCNAPPDMDMDGDGWTGAEGDCNDCDPNVNPGAIDVGNNEDCDPSTSANAPCDSGLFLDDTNPMSAAKAIELCQTASASDKKWGVLSAAYTNANGGPQNVGTQAGIMSKFGTNVNVQGGANMLVLSSGAARTPGQPGACGSESCPHNAGSPPSGFPQDVPGCDGASNINDDIALDLSIRAPTNATGYKFNFKFYSFEFPVWICTEFNDQFIALMNPAPTGSINGNIAFDANTNPVSVNIGFFDVCDPASISQYNGPNPPNPYCPSGPAELAGTGFDIWGGQANSGATSWLATQAPVTGGEEFDIRFAIWDTGDMALYSSVLVDNFQWVANGGMVAVGTTPEMNPK